jgi:DNA polymerase III epsilon subunit family exonuclease
MAELKTPAAPAKVKGSAKAAKPEAAKPKATAKPSAAKAKATTVAPQKKGGAKVSPVAAQPAAKKPEPTKTVAKPAAKTVKAAKAAVAAVSVVKAPPKKGTKAKAQPSETKAPAKATAKTPAKAPAKAPSKAKELASTTATAALALPAPEVQTQRRPKKNAPENKPPSQRFDLMGEFLGQGPQFTPQAVGYEGPMVILDVETTGLDHKVERIIEIGAVKMHNVTGEILGTWSSLINPKHRIDPGSFAVHHISQEMLADAPTMEQVLPSFVDFMGNLPYAGHSVVFDYSFITEAYKRHLGTRFLNPRICTLELYKSVFPEEHSHGLNSMLHRFGHAEDVVDHRALGDALQLAKVYPSLRKLYLQKHRYRYQQLEQINFLVERFVRLQQMLGMLHGEVADLKEAFKLYFSEGGTPIKASNGDVLWASLKRQYEYDHQALQALIDNNGLSNKLGRGTPKLVDKWLSRTMQWSKDAQGNRVLGSRNRQIKPSLLEAMLATRQNMTQSWSIAFTKPSAVPAALLNAPAGTVVLEEDLTQVQRVGRGEPQQEAADELS